MLRRIIFRRYNNEYLSFSRRIETLEAQKSEEHSISRSKFAMELNEDFGYALQEGSVKYRLHPGTTMHNKCIELPEKIQESIDKLLKFYHNKDFSKQAEELTNYLKMRRLPLEGARLERQTTTIYQKMINRGMIPEINENESMEETLNSEQLKQMKWQIHGPLVQWKPLNYNINRSLAYLVGRATSDYACLINIFKEMQKKRSNFVPTTMFDFGSGVGTVTWAIDEVWPGQCKEIVNVDVSEKMNEISSFILKGGEIESPFPLRNETTFYKQFLPTSDIIKYDLVVCSRSLFELGALEPRMRTVDILWRKVSPGGCLVLIEPGTKTGFHILMEARDYLMEISKFEAEKYNLEFPIHVLAPCPHNKFCPRISHPSKTPCHFEARFKSSISGKIGSDKFSYVVFQKQKRTEREWPRIVQDVLKRNNHTILRLCTPEGELKEFVATKGKHSKDLYRLARYSNWGDQIPIHSIESENTEKLEDKNEFVDDSSNMNNDDIKTQGNFNNINEKLSYKDEYTNLKEESLSENDFNMNDFIKKG